MESGVVTEGVMAAITSGQKSGWKKFGRAHLGNCAERISFRTASR